MPHEFDEQAMHVKPQIRRVKQRFDLAIVSARIDLAEVGQGGPKLWAHKQRGLLGKHKLGQPPCRLRKGSRESVLLYRLVRKSDLAPGLT